MGTLIAKTSTDPLLRLRHVPFSMVQLGRFKVDMGKASQLGEGGFGKVYRGRDDSSEPYVDCAVKVLPARPEVMHEVEMLRSVQGHESIIQLLEFMEGSGKQAYLFLELADGGELFDLLITAGKLSERSTLPYAANLLAALAHCHKLGVVHRDVKLENVMLIGEDPDAIKLVDFGLSVKVDLQSGKRFYDNVGSPSYKAPEVFSASKGYAAHPLDSWSSGVLIFSLMAGFFPWEAAKPTDPRFKKYLQAATNGEGVVDHLMGSYRRKWAHSAESKELLDSMLCVDPVRRVSVTDALQHRWISKFLEGGEEMEELEVQYRSLTHDEGAQEPLPESALRP